jgi:hypothetical protein
MLEIIQSNKRTLNNQLIFKLSQIGFALNSKICYTNRIDVGIHDYVEYIAQLKSGDKIFISRTETKVPIHIIVSILEARNVKLIFYLMEEPLFPIDLIHRILPVAIRIFVQNNVYDIPNVHIMPIGIRDCGSIVAMHRRFNHSYLLEAGTEIYLQFTRPINRPPSLRPITCLLCFSTWTHPSRQHCYDLFKNSETTPFVFNLNDDESIFEERKTPEYFYEKIPEKIVYEKTKKSKYALCPRGCGEDTHRFYESISLACIPIVIKTNTVFDRLYTEFPCLTVDKWEDVTEQLLISEYPECWRRMCAFYARYPRFLTDLDSIDDLLLRL